MSVPLAFLSLLLELAFGYPERLVRALGHPVIWIGTLIAWLDRLLNCPASSNAMRRAMGVVAATFLVLASALVGFLIETTLVPIPFGIVATALLGSSLIAQRSLASHVKAVADALDGDGVVAGRKAVSMIVGRDPDQLDEAAVCRAAIESLAENFSDGVVAPAIWMAAGGLGGALAYKAVNTADSMIGHRTPRHEAFGWASARFDDLINLPASRLTGILIVLAAALMRGADPKAAWKTIRRDARMHRSPNAGWPEAAMAGALGISIAGPRAYDGVMGDFAFMGEGGRRDLTSADIRRALRLYWIADAILVAAAGLATAIVWLN